MFSWMLKGNLILLPFLFEFRLVLWLEYGASLHVKHLKKLSLFKQVMLHLEDSSRNLTKF